MSENNTRSPTSSSGTTITCTVTIVFSQTLSVAPDVLIAQAEGALRMHTFGSNREPANPIDVRITVNTTATPETGANT